MLIPEQRTNALIQAGEIFAWARGLPPEGWREVAATPGLGPAYRQAVLHLADFCHQLSGRGSPAEPRGQRDVLTLAEFYRQLSEPEPAPPEPTP